MADADAMFDEFESYTASLSAVEEVEHAETEENEWGVETRTFEVRLAENTRAPTYADVLKRKLFDEFIEGRDYDVESFIFNTFPKGERDLLLVAIISED